MAASLASKDPLTDKDALVLADFANTTGEPVFDGTLRQGLAVQLEQSPFLSIIPDEKIQQTLGLMGQPVDAKLIPAIAREVCQRTESAAALEGSIAKNWHPVSSDAQGGRLRERKNAGERGRQARQPRKDRADALGKVSVAIRNMLGESLSTIQKFATPLAEATTPSLKALKAYSSGMQALQDKRTGSGDAVFQACRRTRPEFCGGVRLPRRHGKHDA